MQTTTAPSWQALAFHAQELKNTTMKELFACDGKRFETMSIEAAGILCDFSKNLMTEKTLDLLLQLARECDLAGWIERMFSGEHINMTENRPVLHTALRKRSKSALLVDGRDVMPEVLTVLAKMRRFSEAVRSGAWTGHTGKAHYRYREYRYRRVESRAGHGHRGPHALWQARSVPCILYPISTARIWPKPCAG